MEHTSENPHTELHFRQQHIRSHHGAFAHVLPFMKTRQRTSAKGFNLVQPMITFCIAVILTAFAIPAYPRLHHASVTHALINDAHKLAAAMRQIATEYPKAAIRKITVPITVDADGSVSNPAIITDDGAIPANKIRQYIERVSSGTRSPILYTLGSAHGEKTFAIINPSCAPSDLAHESAINQSTAPGTPVLFDDDGQPL